MGLDSALARRVDHACEAIELGGGKPGRAVIEQGRDRLLGGSVEERLQQVIEAARRARSRETADR